LSVYLPVYFSCIRIAVIPITPPRRETEEQSKKVVVMEIRKEKEPEK
jgi:hypothetical protein